MSKIIEQIFSYSFILVFITLPMPKYSINSQAIILLFIAWLFSNSLKFKLKKFKINAKEIFLFVSLYIFMLLGFFYSEDVSSTVGNLKSKIPMLIFPIIIFTSEIKFNKKDLFKLFSISTLIFGLFALLKASYIYITGMGNYFTYSDFSLLLNKHTTYYSLFCVISASYFTYEIIVSKYNKIFNLVCLIIILGLIYLLSSRIAVAGLFVVSLLYLNFFLKKKLIKL